MRKICLLSLSLVLAPVVGCSGASAPAAQSDKTPAAEPAATPTATPAATPAAIPEMDAKVADAAKAAEEGCIYNEAKAADKHEEEPGCPHGEGAAQPPGAATGHFGAQFALKDTRPLSQVLASAKAGLKDPVQVSGEVDSVCQKKGCWLVIKDGEAQARILMKDHAFTVPMDSKGKPVVVEGTIEARVFNEAQTKHLAKDAGKDPATVSGETTEYVVTATALELKNS